MCVWQFAYVYGGAVTVALVSLMTGIALQPNVGISAHMCASGRLSDFMGGRVDTVRAAFGAGLTKLFVADFDATRLQRAMQEVPAIPVEVRPSSRQSWCDQLGGAFL